MRSAKSNAILPAALILLTFSYSAKAFDSPTDRPDSGPPGAKSNPPADSALVRGRDISIYVRQTEGPITIDGKLDDPAWREARPYNDYFFQQEPLDRAPSSEKTGIRVLQDQNNLYFGVQCYDSEPEKIFATIKRDDGSFLNDDALELLIDTFKDLRNSYAFGTNPFGAKVDAIISDEGNHINKSWDCIWYCKTARNERGWSVELQIPFKSLKYKAGERVDWGLNITREIKHRKEVTYLVPIPRGLGHNGKFKGSLFGNLKDIRTPPPGLNLEIQPYASAGRTYLYDPRKFDSRLDAGLDIRYHATPRLTLDLSYKTDFAQAESEEEVINVTRFNINLPEKREFFLESEGLFKFGSGASSGGSVVGVQEQPDFILFYSRTVGIKEGRRIPLHGGVKLAGRAGRYSLGVMNLESERSVLDDGAVEPSTNITVVKLKRDFLTNSNIGLLVLNKQSGPDRYSRAVGSDAFLALSPELIVNGSVARAFSPEDDRREWAGDLGAVLNKDWVDFSIRYTHVDTLFNPEMGFVRRGNIRSTNGTLSFTKWINNDYLKSLSLVNGLLYTTDHHNTLDTRENSLELWLTAKSEDFFSFGLHREFEYLPADDFIREIRIGRGRYSTTYQSVAFKSYRARPFVGSLSYRWGEQFDGRSRSLSFTNSTRITNSLNMDLVYSYDRLELSRGALSANLLAGRWTYSFTTELFAKLYVQWNDADHKIATNFLLDYIYRPRSHFYIVFNENRDTFTGAGHRVKDRLLLVKFTYLWSL